MNTLVTWLQPWEPSLPVFLACALAVGLYAIGLIRGASPGFWPALSYFAGVALIYAVTQTHYAYSVSYTHLTLSTISYVQITLYSVIR